MASATDHRAPGKISRLLVWADTTPLNERNLAPFEFLPRTTDFLYLRLLGDYTTKYDVDGGHVHRYEKLLWKREAALESWSLKLSASSEIRNVWAFVSNHFEGFAPETCQRLARRLGFDLPLPSETEKTLSEQGTIAARSSVIAGISNKNRRTGCHLCSHVVHMTRILRLCFSKTHTSRIPKADILCARTRKIIAKLHVRMRVRSACKGNSFLNCEFNDPVAG